jgi:aldehyde oxidoreductase
LRGTIGNDLPLAYESQVNLLAEKLQIDPIDIRLQNSIRTGSKIPTGQTLTESVSMVKELEALKPYYEEAKKRIQKKKGKVSDAWRPGLGVACGWRNIGYLKTTISAGCELDDNGMVHVMAGTVEQGQGPTTQFAQIAADSVGVSMKSVRVTLGDTLSAPYPVPTFSSITTVGTGKAVQIASEMLRERICYAASEILNVEHSLIKVENDCVRLSNSETEVSLLEIAEYFKDKGENSLSESEIKWSGEAPTILYGYNAGLIELEVNIKTGQVILLNHVNVCDPGTRINPDAVDGQIDGAIAFGVGFALSEEFHPDNPPTLKDYGLVSINQIPKEVTRLYVEDPLERGPFGAKSMAEHPGLSITPAIVNGIADATGAWVCDIPATPDRVMAKMAVV